MSIMVIYLMDNGEEEIEVSAEYFGKDAKSFELGQTILNGVLMLENVKYANKKVGSISSPPVSTSLN